METNEHADGCGSYELSPHPDMKLVSEVLERRPGAVMRFMQRMRCVERILVAKNKALGSPLSYAELEEVGQEVLTVVWRKLDRFEGRSSLETWVFRIAVLELMNRVRYSSLRRTAEISDRQLIEAAGTVDPPSLEEFEFVHEALDSLSGLERAVVHAKHFEHETFREIGERLHASENTIKARYYRGMDRLRLKLASYEEDYS